MENIEIEDLIGELISTNELWYVNFYMSSLKKATHGGVFRINKPNYYISHMRKNMFNLFTNNYEDTLGFLDELFDSVIRKIESYNINTDDIANLIFKDRDNWYIAYRLLIPKEEYKNEQAPLIWKIIDQDLRLEDYFILDKKVIIQAFICWLIDNNFIEIADIFEIVKHEKLLCNRNKYGLSKLQNVEYKRQGFILGEKYYLYNLFLDTSIIAPYDNIPGTIKIVLDEIDNVDFMMRVDESLSIDKNKYISTATSDFQVFRGIKLDINDIENLVYKKEIIVHFNPETLNKLVMIIKVGNDEDELYYHIEIEELWNPNIIKDSIMLTNFIHAKYYPSKKMFNHIDFSVNQYDYEIYVQKYTDNNNKTQVPIDKFCDIHYKVWCAEADEISVETWSKLVTLTLDEPFRELFFEMIEANNITAENPI